MRSIGKKSVYLCFFIVSARYFTIVIQTIVIVIRIINITMVSFILSLFAFVWVLVSFWPCHRIACWKKVKKTTREKNLFFWRSRSKPLFQIAHKKCIKRQKHQLQKKKGIIFWQVVFKVMNLYFCNIWLFFFTLASSYVLGDLTWNNNIQAYDVVFSFVMTVRVYLLCISYSVDHCTSVDLW